MDAISSDTIEQKKIRVMVVFAHPDEGEIYAGGTAALYAGMGHEVKFLSLTNGDAGHFSMRPEDLAARRYQEAMDAKKILGLSDYEIFDYHDGFLQNTAKIRRQVAESIEAWDADIVFAFYPAAGGHSDNMNAGWIVREAAPKLQTQKTPVFLYMRDFHTSQFSYLSDLAVIIDEVWETKLAGCGAHVSQVLEYNPNLQGVLEEVQASEAKQQEFRFDNTYAFSHIRPDNMPALTRWHGTERAKKATYVEAFEIAEYGRQITDQEIRVLLPMLAPPPSTAAKNKRSD
jgi:LmbE family N-acetylglucosaminyl deacetylase